MNKIKHSILTLDSVANIVSWFVFDDLRILPTSKLIFQMYPELIGQLSPDEPNLQRKIKSLISENYDVFLKNNSNIIEKYDQLVLNYADDFFNILNEYFEINKSYNIDVQIGPIPIFPRFIKEETYCMGVIKDEEVIETFMHETSHFAFFEKCKQIFINLDDQDMDKPALLWYLSEMVVDPILNSQNFQQLFDYKFKAYDNFYNIIIEDKPIMHTIKDIFNTYDIETAIIASYNYLIKNEKEFKNSIKDEIRSKELLIRNKTKYDRIVKGISFDFKTPHSLLEYMDNFEYKWSDKEGKIHSELEASMYENYSFMTPKEVVLNNCGICIDQSNFASIALFKMGFNVKNYTIQFFKENTSPGHAFIVYENNKKFYWFENAWGANKGIHEYNSIEDLFNDVSIKLFDLEKPTEKEKETLTIEESIEYPYHCSYEEMDKIKELYKLIKNKKVYFHGSPDLVEELEPRQSSDSSGNKINCDNALFLTDSFLMASAYAFKDTIKKDNVNFKFDITLRNKIPFMNMENVNISDDIEGYIYAFNKDIDIINEPVGSNQFKSYKNLKSIERIKIKYKDFKFLYNNCVDLNHVKSK